MGWGLFPLFGWQPRCRIAYQSGITPATRPKRSNTTDAPATSGNPDPNPNAPASGGSRNNPRPQNRKSGSAKRGRRR